jgi:hypothetical protein
MQDDQALDHATSNASTGIAGWLRLEIIWVLVHDDGLPMTSVVPLPTVMTSRSTLIDALPVASATSTAYRLHGAPSSMDRRAACRGLKYAGAHAVTGAAISFFVNVAMATRRDRDLGGYSDFAAFWREGTLPPVALPLGFGRTTADGPGIIMPPAHPAIRMPTADNPISRFIFAS